MQRAQLIDPANSVLIVIDVQDPFLDKLSPDTRQLLVEHLRWLIGTARWLRHPGRRDRRGSPRARRRHARSC